MEIVCYCHGRFLERANIIIPKPKMAPQPAPKTIAFRAIGHLCCSMDTVIDFCHPPAFAIRI